MKRLTELQKEALWVLWMSASDESPVRIEYNHHTLKRLERFGFIKIAGKHETRSGYVVSVTPEGATEAKAINDKLFKKRTIEREDHDVVDESEG